MANTAKRNAFAGIRVCRCGSTTDTSGRVKLSENPCILCLDRHSEAACQPPDAGVITEWSGLREPPKD